MNITAEGVEAAAKMNQALYFSEPWESLSDFLRNERLREAELILEAAAPYIAGAWHDAVSEAYVEGALSLEQASVMWNKNPYRTPDAR